MTDTKSAPSSAEPALFGAEGDFDASGDAVSGTEDGEEVASHEDCNERLAYFVTLAEPDLMEYDPYHDFMLLPLNTLALSLST
jgi:hypothetical protein